MALDRRFVSSLVEIQYQSVVQTLSNYSIFDSGAGVIFVETGFTRVERPLLYSRDPLVRSGNLDWSIEYTAGFTNPGSVPEEYKMGCLEVIKVLFFSGGDYAMNPAMKSGKLADAAFTMQDTGRMGAGSATIMNNMIREFFETEIV